MILVNVENVFLLFGQDQKLEIAIFCPYHLTIIPTLKVAGEGMGQRRIIVIS